MPAGLARACVHVRVQPSAAHSRTRPCIVTARGSRDAVRRVLAVGRRGRLGRRGLRRIGALRRVVAVPLLHPGRPGLLRCGALRRVVDGHLVRVGRGVCVQSASLRFPFTLVHLVLGRIQKLAGVPLQLDEVCVLARPSASSAPSRAPALAPRGQRRDGARWQLGVRARRLVRVARHCQDAMRAVPQTDAQTRRAADRYAAMRASAGHALQL